MASSSLSLPECPICMESYLPPNVIPKSMPTCPHTFCLKCLQNMSQNEAITLSRIITCPECRLMTRLGQGGVEGFQTNLAVQRIVDQMLQAGIGSSTGRTSIGWSVPLPPSHQPHHQSKQQAKQLSPPRIDAGCTISASAIIEPGVKIHSGCTVEANAVIKSGTAVHSGAMVKSGAIVGNNVTIQSGALIGPFAIINEGCVICSGARVGENTVLPPNYRLSPGTFLG